MNLTARYEAGEWVVIVMPRRRHRPWEPGEGILTAPGAADMGASSYRSAPKTLRPPTPRRSALSTAPFAPRTRPSELSDSISKP